MRTDDDVPGEAHESAGSAGQVAKWWYVVPTIHPKTGKAENARLPAGKAHWLSNHGPRYKFHEMLTLLPETLANRHAIFPYSCDDFDGFCYALKPTYQMRNNGKRAKAPDGEVYLVFTDSRLMVTEFRFEAEDPVRPGWPENRKGRLGTPIWTNRRGSA